jgi:membrane-associated phospholipid phosphatase
MPTRTPSPRRAIHVGLGVVVLLLARGSTAQGDDQGTHDKPTPRRDELTYDVRVDIPITVGAGAFWLGSDVVGDNFAPDGCRWCASNGLDDAFRDALRWENTGAAHTASNVIAYVALPAAELGLLALAAWRDGRRGELAGNVLVVGEAVTISGALVQMVKYTVGRERPYVHALPPAAKGTTDDPGDNNLSFYSSHTSFAFALATGAGSVATLRGYRAAPAIWAVGAAAALTVGYLRIAADRHYFTDVLTGAAIGTAMGVGVPFLFHRQRRPGASDLALVPTAGRQGSGIALVGIW